MPIRGPYTHGPYSPVVGSLLPVVVIALIATSHVWRTPAHPSMPRWYRVALLLCLALAAGNYVAFGEFRYGSYMNEWDIAHYYTGTKYAPELGYFDQYEAIWLADYDTGLRSSASFVMLTTLHMIAHSVRRASIDLLTPGRVQVDPTLDVLERFS